MLYLRQLVGGFPSRWPEFDPRSGHVVSVVDKVTLGQVPSDYFGFPANPHSIECSKFNLSSGAGTIGQLMSDVPNGHSLTPPEELNSDAPDFHPSFHFLEFTQALRLSTFHNALAYDSELFGPRQTPRQKTSSRLPSSTDYSIQSLLPSVPWGRLLHQQSKNAACHFVKELS
jgi:hypothetical protein